jgi:D-tyrosyl-tRNA(Tyr) deacylase
VKTVIQRVRSADVAADGETVGRIGPGLLVLVGVADGDRPADAEFLAAKIVNLRIFADSAGRFNLSLLDTGGEMLVVSQFTLLADCRKGRRPSFVGAADPETGKRLYRYFVDRVRSHGVAAATGRFQAAMAVSLVNDGPVTIVLDSRGLSKSR